MQERTVAFVCQQEGGRGGMSLISAATILTPFYRSSLSRADFVRARNTAHTATSPVAMKNYPPFVEKERHQSSPPDDEKERGSSLLCPPPTSFSRRVASATETFEFSPFLSIQTVQNWSFRCWNYSSIVHVIL